MAINKNNNRPTFYVIIFILEVKNRVKEEPSLINERQKLGRKYQKTKLKSGQLCPLVSLGVLKYISIWLVNIIQGKHFLPCLLFNMYSINCLHSPEELSPGLFAPFSFLIKEAILQMSKETFHLMKFLF